MLRERWPIAFPAQDQNVCPLAIGTASEIAAAMGWSLRYTLGVLAGWKMAMRKGKNGDEEVKSIAADTEEVLLDDQDEAVDTTEIIDADIEKDDT